ncbi:innexin unc-9 [Trichinella spiralis]|nr:innexin unc-9 [Trichinella spiralis]
MDAHEQGLSDWSILIRLGAYFFCIDLLSSFCRLDLFVRRMKMSATNK